MLEDGECLNDNVPPYLRAMFDRMAAESPDRTVMLPFPIFREAFMNDADLDTVKQAYARLSPEPYQFAERLDLKKFYSIIRSGKVACSYLYGTEDIALPPGGTRRVGLASAHVEPTGPLQAGADARQPRADLLRSDRSRAEGPQGRARLKGSAGIVNAARNSRARGKRTPAGPRGPPACGIPGTAIRNAAGHAGYGPRGRARVRIPRSAARPPDINAPGDWRSDRRGRPG